MLSTHDDQVTMVNCMQSGANDFISYPEATALTVNAYAVTRKKL